MSKYNYLKHTFLLCFARTIDIHSKAFGVGGRLSNFTKREFVFDGVSCQSIEGVLQSFKCKDSNLQNALCALYGEEAKNAGTEYDEWKSTQTLYWDAVEYKRNSAEYQHLLDRLYQAVFEQDEEFANDLRQKCRKYKLIHSIGEKDSSKTVLTEDEFCKRLTSLCNRKDILNG